MQWPTAKTHCESLGMTLAILKSRQESEFVFGLSSDPQARWLGARRADAQSDLMWIDGTPLLDLSAQYKDCEPNIDCQYQQFEPDNWIGVEHCLAMGWARDHPHPSGWNDGKPCSAAVY